MRNKFSTTLIALGILLGFSAAASAAPRSADEIFKKVKDTVNNLQSFKYVVQEDDYQDEILKARVSNALTAFRDDANKVSAALGEDKDIKKEVTDEKIKSGTYGVKFVRPYLREMIVLKSGYLPDTIQFLKNAVLFYRPDVEPELLYMKSKSGMVLFRPIKEIETGGFFTVTCWLYDMIEADFLLDRGGKMSLSEEVKLDDRDTWVAQIEIKDNASLNKPYAFADKESGIPAPVWTRIDRELEDMTKRIRLYKQGMVKYWIDKEKFLILKKEIHFGGKVIIRKTLHDVKTDHLKKEDILSYTPKGKKAGK